MKKIVSTLVPALAAALLAGLGCREDAESPTEPAPELAATAAAALSFRQISVGSGHACGVTNDNRAYCWGSNSSGALGIGVTKPVDDYSTRPVAVVGGLRFRLVSAGGAYTCGLTTDDLAYCWGLNRFAQLGDGTRTTRLRPVPVTGGRRFRQLRAGAGHTCAVTWSDVAFCWGDNTYGQLGDGTTHGPLRPVRVAGGLALRRVLAARTHTCGGASGGRTYCWGDNSFGQLGDGTTTQRLTPVRVQGGLLFGQLSAGNFHSCGVTGNRAYCWGRNRHGALGDGTITRRLTPVAVAGGLQFSGVSAGHQYTCGVTTGNRAYCWGNNHSGRLGDGTANIDRLKPVAVSGGLFFGSVSTSLTWFSTCGVTTADRGYCWGDNSVGQLGHGHHGDVHLTPAAVVGP
jgi:alpha-tubulin suppressor-like RCC1 family protein